MSEPAERLPSYAVVSPVKDEAGHLARTAESMVSQTHRPLQWVIVDDGSTDGSREIARRYAEEHEWIVAIDSGATATRARGARVVRAFEAGRAALRERPDITVKMDGDLFLPAHYYEWVARTFARQPRAGIVGGTILEYDGTIWKPADFNPRHVRGAFKAYRTDCLEDIGGLRAEMGWDGIDEYAARARGWVLFVLTELVVLHYKPRGSKQKWWKARWEEGRASHYMGYRADFLLVRAGFRMAKDTPPVVGALALVAGYAWSRLRGQPQIDDPRAMDELRREQRTRLRAMVGRGRPPKPSALPGGGPAFWKDADADTPAPGEAEKD